MGELARFPLQGKKEVFAPVNPRLPSQCRVIIYDDDTDERVNGCVGVQYAVGEYRRCGYHAIMTPDSDGVIVRYTEIRPDGTVAVYPTNPDFSPRCYPFDDVTFNGMVFQFIKDWDTGERWELITGNAVAAQAEDHIFIRPVFVAH